MSISSFIYRTSRVLHTVGRIAGDVSAVATGDPQRMKTRLLNRLIGAGLFRLTRGLYRRKW
jgi:hypothetical protein